VLTEYNSTGLHESTSRWDPDRTPHATIRLSNAQLREEDTWFTLHWRPGSGGSMISPLPDNTELHEQNKAVRKAKKQRQQARKRERKRERKDKDKDGGAGGSGTATTTTAGKGSAIRAGGR
jgi:hypothetical protein